MHESKCRNLHGHTYIIEVTASAPQLDSLGRIIDFGVIKEKLGTWLDDQWDHGFLLWHEDPLSILWTSAGGVCDPSLEDHKFFLLPYNPTAENIGRYLVEVTCPRLFSNTDVEVTKVVVHETPNCFATVVKNEDS